jgi:hypothetical protein
MPTAAATKASHALRSVIEGNQEQPAFPIKNPDSWSYSTGPPHQLRAGTDVEAVETDLQRSIDIAQRQSAKIWELRATTNLARLWRDQGKRTEAHDILAPIYGWFTEGFDTPVLQDAKALLGQL